MNELHDKLSGVDGERAELTQQEEDLVRARDVAKEEAEASREDVEECSSEDDDDVELLENLKAEADEKSKTALKCLDAWRKENQDKMQELENSSRNLQKHLKSICALVRNEYSKSCLQEDFRAGLEQLCRKPDEEGDDERGDTAPTPLPDDFEMDVYCISANDYLKLQKIKPPSDGPANTFFDPRDTQIPALRSFVHETTARIRTMFTKSVVNSASDLLDRVKLLALDTSDSTDSEASQRYKSVFDTEMKAVMAKVQPVVEDFKRKAEAKVEQSLQPSIKSGAAKGNAAAMATVMSWGSKSRRSRNFRSPESNGLYWSTYQATARRDGVYTSASAGQVDFNQELCDPMEKEFSRDWQQTMDSTIKLLLADCEAKVLQLCNAVNRAVASGLSQKGGIESDRLASMVNAASRSCTTALKQAFHSMRDLASDSQRGLNRSLLPMVKQRMAQGYTSALAAPRGAGFFSRMKQGLEGYSHGAVSSMFNESTMEMLKSVDTMIKDLAGEIAATAELITKTLENVYSVCWEDHADKGILVDPARQTRVRECREKILPDLAMFRQVQDEAMGLVGIVREELDLEMMGVDSPQSRLDQQMEEAYAKGIVIEILDDSSDEETEEDEGEKKMSAIERIQENVTVPVKEEQCILQPIYEFSDFYDPICDYCPPEEEAWLYDYTATPVPPRTT